MDIFLSNQWRLFESNVNSIVEGKKKDDFGLFNGLNSFFIKNLKTKIIIFNKNNYKII